MPRTWRRIVGIREVCELLAVDRDWHDDGVRFELGRLSGMASRARAFRALTESE
jgi:hypothetical protein